MKHVFLDIETTGLDPLRHAIVEVGMVIDPREPTLPEHARHFSLPLGRGDLEQASPGALEINRYHERKDELDAIEENRMGASEILIAHLSGALVIGTNVQFDLRFIERLIGSAPWYYAPLELKSWVAGRCGMAAPASTKLIAEVSGVRPGDNAHSALADARWNREVYRALSGN